MSNRARYETKDGEHLTISRGTLRIRSGETGGVDERTLAGPVMYDATSRKLHTPVSVVTVDKDTKVRSTSVSTIVFDIAKDPGQVRGESRAEFVSSEKTRLLRRVQGLSPTLGADPSGMGGSPNPAYEAAKVDLAHFCKKYGLDINSVLRFQGHTAKTEETEERPRKKAKERRAEETT